jgi:hypothetical protein
MNQMLMMMMMIMMKRRKKKKKTKMKMKTKHIQVTVNQMMMTTSKHKEHIEHVALQSPHLANARNWTITLTSLGKTHPWALV